MTDLASSLEDLVKNIVEAAKDPKVKLSDKVEVLKICSQHYVNISKVKGKRHDPDDKDDPGSGFTMATLSDKVHGESGQQQESPGDEDDETDSD